MTSTGAVRIIRGGMTSEVTRAAMPLFYVTAALALAAVAVLAIGH